MNWAKNKPTDIQAARALRVVAIDGAQGVILPAGVLALASGQMEKWRSRTGFAVISPDPGTGMAAGIRDAGGHLSSPGNVREFR